MEYSLIIQNLTVSIENKEVVKDVSLEIRPGEIHALMGPNGSGKSSLAYAIAGHPEYKVTNGKILLGDIDLLSLAPEERAQAGLFMSFQEPPEVGGVSMNIFLSTIATKLKSGIMNHESRTDPLLSSLGLDKVFLQRFLNDGFSGGEKKKSEILQFLARKPRFAIFDEIDSGLDLDSLQSACEIITKAAANGAGIILITHSPRIFDYINPHRIHFLLEGKIAASGNRESIHKLQEGGYKMVTQSVQI